MKIKTTLGRIFLLALLLTLPRAGEAQFIFDIATNNGSITIRGGTGSGAANIPASTNGYPVTSVAVEAFYFANITSVTIPDSVTNIGNNAFNECNTLTNVVIGNGVTSIGMESFGDCSMLTNVIWGTNLATIGENAFAHSDLTSLALPNSVTSLGSSAFGGCQYLTNVFIGSNAINVGSLAFGGCTRLAAITVDSNNPAYCSLDNVLFDKSQTTLIQCPSLNKVTFYAVPSSVTSITGSAFAYCHSLASITIDDAVTNIGDQAFFDDTGLTNVILGSNLASIGTFAFTGTGITSLTMPASLVGLGSYALYGCGYMTAVYFPGNAPAGTDSTTFDYDNTVTTYYLPGTTGWSAFAADAGIPVAPWLPQIQNDASFGVQTNQFGFNLNWASGQTVVVEGCTNLFNPVWLPLQTNTLTSGSAYFGDSQWSNYPSRFYRVKPQ